MGASYIYIYASQTVRTVNTLLLVFPGVRPSVVCVAMFDPNNMVLSGFRFVSLGDTET